MKNELSSPRYDRGALKSGILHIGVGNFHRAHEEAYTDALLNLDPAQNDWGITGAMLLPSDEALYNALNEQKGQYTLTACAPDGSREVRRIGALTNVLWAPRHAEEILAKIADPDTRIISMTITEGGYNIDKETGEFDLKNEAIRRDLSGEALPRTVFGFVAEGLRRRMKGGDLPVTIMSCDNLQHNGDVARRAFTAYFEALDPELARWAEKNVTFPNSMVDRITPATTPADVERLNSENGTDDKAPVYCEDFIQWVIEDKFASTRPEWERVGVQFTDDVSPYENMKLSLLNASHTLLSYPSFLMGYRRVDEAMNDPLVAGLVRDFMNKDITPYVPAPQGVDLDEYKETLVRRFANPAVSDQVGRLCYDGLSKFPVYVVPNLAKMIDDGKDLTRVAFLLAAYRHYLKYRRDDLGHEFEVAEPWMNPSDQALIDSPDMFDFLGLSAFAGANLQDERFREKYQGFCEAIMDKGTRATLASIL